MKFDRYFLGLVAVVLALACGLSACAPTYEIRPKDYLPTASIRASEDRLTAQFFGVSTILLRDGKKAVMTDGFFSRPTMGTMRPSKPSPRAILAVDSEPISAACFRAATRAESSAWS